MRQLVILRLNQCHIILDHTSLVGRSELTSWVNAGQSIMVSGVELSVLCSQMWPTMPQKHWPLACDGQKLFNQTFCLMFSLGFLICSKVRRQKISQSWSVRTFGLQVGDGLEDNRRDDCLPVLLSDTDKQTEVRPTHQLRTNSYRLTLTTADWRQTL